MLANSFYSIALIFSILLSPMVNAAFSGEVVRVNGVVKVDGKNLKKGDLVKMGQTIDASTKGSFAHIKFKNGPSFLIKEGSVKLKTIKKEITFLQLIKGTFFGHLKPRSKQKMKVNGRYTSFGIRGTKFYIQTSKEEDYLCVCSGSVLAASKESKIIVKQFQDLHHSANGEVVKTGANKDMWKMAKEGFSMMDLEIPALR